MLARQSLSTVSAKCAVIPLAASAARVLSGLQGDAFRAIRAIDAGQLITERADLCGFPLGNAVSAGGSCRILKARDGVIALSLARVDDWDLLPALLDSACPGRDWDGVVTRVSKRDADMLVERGALLGLAIARADRTPEVRAPVRLVVQSPCMPPPERAPLVLDMSALWAGPLCGHLLERAGATVIKLESDRRSDGARRGNADFFALLNQRKHCVAIDFDHIDGRALLLRLIHAADIVIESARPRALRHIGIDAETLVRQRPGLVWIAISGYGRGADEEQRIAYGDDAGAAAGLSAALHRVTGRWAFLEDAIADPLTGIHAARAAWDHWRAGQGGLISVALRDVAAWSLADERAVPGGEADARLARWLHDNSDGRRRAAQPSRPIERPARAPGADNHHVESLLSRC